MKPQLQAALTGVVAIVLAVLGTLWWNANMELRWAPEHKPSAEIQKNKMYVASLLLRQHGHAVTVAGTLGESGIGNLPDGTLLMADTFGMLPAERAEQLLAWVRRGNTLVVQPRWMNGREMAAHAHATAPPQDDAPDASAGDDAQPDDGDDSDDIDDSAPDGDPVLSQLTESDPIAVRYGVRRHRVVLSASCLAQRKARAKAVEGQARTSCPAPIAACQTHIVRQLLMPGSAHSVQVEDDYDQLLGMPGAPAPLWADTGSNTVRAYAEGKGRVVMVASNYFDNGTLQARDHAELLLGLVALHPGKGHVTIIKYLDVLPWYQLLWERAYMLALGCATLLALALWAALRRFGPLLPEPVSERRSLMEHIDASGAWLWRASGGRELLLSATRDDTLAQVRRRAPALMRLPEHELAEALAAQCALSAAQIKEALYGAAASHPTQFARQIRTLQTLRNHHER